MPTDQLNFHIDVLSHSVDSNSVTRLKTLLRNYQDWFQAILFHHDFPYDSLEKLALKLVSEVNELFEFDERLFGSGLADGVGPSDARRFTLHLRIVVEI